jgi:hypothetical protein
MEWMTVKEAGLIWGISARRATILCADGKVNGAERLGNIWVIPKGTPKPVDGRTRAARLEKTEAHYL